MKRPYLVVSLALLGAPACGPPAGAPASLPYERGGEAPAALVRLPEMGEPRASHSATLLEDGTVLIAGGFRKGPDGRSQLYSATAEIYDPAAREMRPAGRMLAPRCGHTATRLPGGEVLLAGGFNEGGLTAAAELYRPSTGAFTAAGEMTRARGGFTATLLRDGRVLLAGGGDGAATDTAELYDPVTGRFTPTGAMTAPRLGHTATPLPDGGVLLIGGTSGGGAVLESVERYDPVRGRFEPAGRLAAPRYKHAAALLPDGRVLVVGGSDARDWRGKYSAAELYDPATGESTRLAARGEARFKLPGAVAALDGGRVLIAGGAAAIEIFGAAELGFRVAARLEAANYFATATPLPGGGVLLAGGYDDRIVASRSAWLFRDGEGIQAGGHP